MGFLQSWGSIPHKPKDVEVDPDVLSDTDQYTFEDVEVIESNKTWDGKVWELLKLSVGEDVSYQVIVLDPHEHTQILSHVVGTEVSAREELERLLGEF